VFKILAEIYASQRGKFHLSRNRSVLAKTYFMAVLAAQILKSRALGIGKVRSFSQKTGDETPRAEGEQGRIAHKLFTASYSSYSSGPSPLSQRK